MIWSYILYLPAVVSIVWALVIVLTKKHLTHGQILFCFTLIVDAFAIAVAGVFFRGRAGNLFIYNYLLEVSAILCSPMYYISICSLTESRGAILRQRRVFFIPLLFIVGLTIGSFGVHPSSYDAMCRQAFEDGYASIVPGYTAYNFMVIWVFYLFPIVTILMGIVLLILGERKIRRYKKSFDSYYAQGLNQPKLNIREIVIISWLFLPFGMLTFYFIAFRPIYYKYWLILCMLMLTVIQYLTGRFAYRYNYDARYLANYIRNQIDSK